MTQKPVGFEWGPEQERALCKFRLWSELPAVWSGNLDREPCVRLESRRGVQGPGEPSWMAKPAQCQQQASPWRGPADTESPQRDEHSGQIHVYPEARKVTLFGNRARANTVRKDFKTKSS